MTLAQFGKDAVARYNARHAEADDALYNLAGFFWNPIMRRFEVEVCSHIVALLPTLAEVRTFCAMHNTTRTE